MEEAAAAAAAARSGYVRPGRRTESHHGCLWLCCDTGGASFNVVRNTSPGNNKYRSRSLFTPESIIRA